MSGITSNTGIFSGINSSQLIDQLIQAASQPKTLAQQRVVSLQTLQTAFLDINTRLAALKTASANFGLNRTFDSALATSSDTTTLAATASPGAAAGTYSFLVDRLVSTQQNLTRGFADSTTTAVGLTSLTFEGAEARLDSPTRLTDVNGGAGITRGKVLIKDSAGVSTTIDLSRVETVNDIAKAFSDTTGGKVTIQIDGDRIKLVDGAGGAGSLTIADAPGTTGTTASLGLDVAASGSPSIIAGRQINRVGANTALRVLNDRLGVSISTTAGTATPDFQFKTADGSSLDIDIGDMYSNVVPPDGGTAVLTKTSSAVSDLGGVISRINSQSGGKVTASINAAGTGLKLVDNTSGSNDFEVVDFDGRTTATDLGLTSGASGNTVDGSRLIASIDSTLLKSTRGGLGIAGSFALVGDRNGGSYIIQAPQSGSVSDLIKAFSDATSGAITLELNSTGSGLVVRDNTGGTGALSLSGALATQLGVSGTFNAATAQGANLQKQYIGAATKLSSLNSANGIGTGQFSITDSFGSKFTISIGADAQTVGDVIAQINSSLGSPHVKARINDHGDGIILEEHLASGEVAGGAKITVADVSGTVAKSLNLVGTASGTGASNKIDGSFERTVALGAGDTLQQVIDKINSAGVNATASIINDGSSSTPFRISLTSRNSGEAGRFILDTGGFDLGISTLADGTNARVFYGGSDPAKSVLLSSTSNTLANVVQGLTLNLKGTSTTPVTVSVGSDTDTITKAVQDFVTAFNNIAQRIDSQSKYDSSTQKSGPLLGNSTSQTLRSALAQTLSGPATGVSGRYQYLSQLGLTFDQAGKLSLDTTKLTTAIQTDPTAVKNVFSAKTAASTSTSSQREISPGIFVTDTTQGAYSSLGVLEKIAQLADRYVTSGTGILSVQNQTLTNQIKFQNDRISAFDVQLNSKRSVLQKQFLAMEQTIGKLQGQQGSLGQIKSIA